MQAKMERRLLTESVFAALAFAILGVVLGLITGSHMILFDGFYSFVSVLLSLVSLTAAKFMHKKDEVNYPFGKSMVEPLVIVFKYSILLLIVLYAMMQAIVSISRGGRMISIDIALAYAFIGALACLFVFLRLKIKSAQYPSGILLAEASQWFMDTLVTFAVFMAFLGMLILTQFNQFTFIIPYLDPLMVLLVTLVFLKTPAVEIIRALKEIVQVKPSKQRMKEIEKAVLKIKNKYKFEETFIRATEDRTMLWVEVDFVASDDTLITTLDEQDAIREELTRLIKGKALDKWFTISFTKDRKWAI